MHGFLRPREGVILARLLTKKQVPGKRGLHSEGSEDGQPLKMLLDIASRARLCERCIQLNSFGHANDIHRYPETSNTIEILMPKTGAV